MILATEESIKSGNCTLYELKCFLKHVRLSAQHIDVKLSWKYEDGRYWGYLKHENKVLFQKPYNEPTLLDAIIQMHLDFQNVLQSAPLKKNK